VYGLVLAFREPTARRVNTRQEALAVVRAATALAALGCVSLLLWKFGTADAAASPDVPPGLRIVDTMLGDLAAMSAETLVFALLPLRFLRGHALWAWSKPAWCACYAPAVGLFLAMLFGVATPTSAEQFPQAAVAFTAFGVASVAFWVLCVVLRRTGVLAGPDEPAADEPRAAAAPPLHVTLTEPAHAEPHHDGIPTG
jgi:hypothetical protein